MKILVDAIPMTGLLTGIARYLRNLYGMIDHLALAETRYFTGWHPKETLPPPANPRRREQLIHGMRSLPDSLLFGLRTARWIGYETRLNQVCCNRKHGIDLYHETAFTPAKVTAVPTVFSMYDLSLMHYRETHPADRVRLFDYFIRTRLKYARHVLTISEFIRQEIMDTFNLPGSRVSSVPLAPDPQFYPRSAKTTARVRAYYHLPEQYLLCVGSLEPRKNISLLIDALARAVIDIPLVLTGWSGWGDKAWMEKIDTASLKNRVFFTGHVPDPDLSAIYTGAAALVYPSFYEGFGLPVLEAMACGCPVICSHAASLPEVAGDAALFIDPFDADSLVQAIDNLVPDKGCRQRMTTAGLARAAQFTWEKTARQTLEIFRRVA
jgi:alpha-1,3-rhamnosyl/mannosyltransferase